MKSPWEELVAGLAANAGSGAIGGMALGGPVGAGIGAGLGLGVGALDFAASNRSDAAALAQQAALQHDLDRAGSSADWMTANTSRNAGDALQMATLDARQAAARGGSSPGESQALVEGARRAAAQQSQVEIVAAQLAAQQAEREKRAQILQEYTTAQDLRNAATQDQGQFSQLFGQAAGAAAQLGGIKAALARPVPTDTRPVSGQGTNDILDMSGQAELAGRSDLMSFLDVGLRTQTDAGGEPVTPPIVDSGADPAAAIPALNQEATAAADATGNVANPRIAPPVAAPVSAPVAPQAPPAAAPPNMAGPTAAAPAATKPAPRVTPSQPRPAAPSLAPVDAAAPVDWGSVMAATPMAAPAAAPAIPGGQPVQQGSEAQTGLAPPARPTPMVPPPPTLTPEVKVNIDNMVQTGMFGDLLDLLESTP